jgi:retron-type reverse transcriptase
MNINFLSKYQFGFRKKYSTIDALHLIQKLITENLNHKKKCAVITIDIRKAFDTVKHNLILKKLREIGINSK